MMIVGPKVGIRQVYVIKKNVHGWLKEISAGVIPCYIAGCVHPWQGSRCAWSATHHARWQVRIRSGRWVFSVKTPLVLFVANTCKHMQTQVLCGKSGKCSCCIMLYHDPCIANGFPHLFRSPTLESLEFRQGISGKSWSFNVYSYRWS